MSACQIDNASEVEEKFTGLVLANFQAAQPKFESFKFCVDCDGEIPEARRNHSKGVTRCVHCQGDFEAKGKAYGNRGRK